MWNKENSNTSFEYPATAAVPTYPAVQQAQEPEGWCERNYKNKPQSNSVGAAALVFISGGMFLTGPSHATFIITNWVRMSWCVGGIVGVIIGAIACNKIRKKFITCFASLLVSVSGILLVADPNSLGANISARFINGCAVGLVFLLTLVLAGEQVVKSMRGMNVSAIDAMCYSTGMFLHSVYSNAWPAQTNNSFSSTQTMGCLCIFWGFLSFILGFALQIESPLLYLSHGHEEMAIDCLRRLQRPFTITFETYQQLDELKLYLAENREYTFMESVRNGWPALVKLCFYRSFMALSFSYILNLTLSYAVSFSMEQALWVYTVYGLLRWIGALVVAFSLDYKGRKPPMITGFLICSCLLFAIGGVLVEERNLIDETYMEAVIYLLLIYQFFAGISMGSCSAYLSEAFPLQIKPYFIAAAFVVEMLVHIAIISCSNEAILVQYFFAVGGLSLLFFFLAVIAMPETKILPLRECLVKFRKMFG